MGGSGRSQDRVVTQHIDEHAYEVVTYLVLSGRCAPEGFRKIQNSGFSDLHWGGSALMHIRE